MGLFLKESDIAKKVEESRPSRSDALKAPPKPKQQRITGGTGCNACSIKGRWGTLTSPRMEMQGDIETGEILVLGGHPSEEADKKGAPFGPESRILMDLLSAREREHTTFQNAARCHAGAAGPGVQDLHACSVYLDEEVARGKFRYVIGVGGDPLHRFWPGANIARVHGIRLPIKLGGKTLWYMPVLDPSFVSSKGGMRTPAGAAFAADIRRLFRERKTWGRPTVAHMDPKDILYPQTEQEARDILARMANVPLGVDIETKKLKPYMKDSAIITAAVSDGVVTMAFACAHPQKHHAWGIPLVLEIVQERRWVAHNAIFEIVWFLAHMEAGARLAPFDDSMALARHFHDRETVISLEHASMSILGVDVNKLSHVDPKHIMDYPLSDVLPYNGLDAQASALIQQRIGKEMQGPNYQRSLESTLTVAMMESLGLPIDLEAAKELDAEWGGQAEIISANARKLYEARQYELTTGKTFNIGSGEQLGIALVNFGKLKLPRLQKEGTYKTDDESLTTATKDNPNPLADMALKYRGALKNAGTYIKPILAVPEEYKDGLLHPSYTVNHTATLRLSSTDPNIQNFPARQHKEIRRQIITPPGLVFCKVDYGQLEARLVAMASRDDFLCSSIISGYDIHGFWRDFILKMYPPYMDVLVAKTGLTDEAKLIKAGRNDCKQFLVFASFFGASLKTVARGLGLPDAIVADILEEFWRQFPGVKKWIKNQRRMYDDEGLVRTLTGRTRRGLLWGNEPINTPIQGSGADVVTDAMNELRQMSDEMNEPCLMPRINIHDDLSFFLPEDEAEMMGYIDIIGDVMTTLRYDWQIVPFMAEVSIGTNWADPEEVTTYTGAYHK